jgi:hypothetical protein
MPASSYSSRTAQARAASEGLLNSLAASEWSPASMAPPGKTTKPGRKELDSERVRTSTSMPSAAGRATTIVAASRGSIGRILAGRAVSGRGYRLMRQA